MLHNVLVVTSYVCPTISTVALHCLFIADPDTACTLHSSLRKFHYFSDQVIREASSSDLKVSQFPLTMVSSFTSIRLGTCVFDNIGTCAV